MYRADSSLLVWKRIMMKKPEYDILMKFLDGDCTEAEWSTINEWANQNEENRREIELLRKINNIPEIPFPEPDVDAAFNNVSDRIHNLLKENSANIYTINNENTGWSLKNILLNPAYLRAAVVLLGTLAALYYIFSVKSPDAYNVIYAQNGEQKEVALPDGSIVTLDAGSTIMFSENYGEETRRVQLDGEGFFDVVSDPNTPFIVYSNDALVTVLGTKFNLRSWKNNENKILAVEEGKVSFENDADNSNGDTVIVFEGQMSEIEMGASPSVPVNVDLSNYLSWRNREMYFQNVELSEVINQLQRWYDIRIILPDKSYNSNRVTMNIRNTPLEQNLDVLSLVMNFSYERNGNVITFNQKTQ